MTQIADNQALISSLAVTICVVGAIIVLSYLYSHTGWLVSPFAAFREGGTMSTQQDEEKQESDVEFRVFKSGLLLMSVAFAFWLVLMALNEIMLALGAAAVGFIGACAVMLSILGSRRAGAKRA
jgi:hypothetical protein